MSARDLAVPARRRAAPRATPTPLSVSLALAAPFFREFPMRLRHLFAVACFAVATPALAAPCTGFTDVDSTNAFCPNVEWLKNRAVTLGCTSTTLYCPTDPVSRLAMAAFMNRLGTALTPALLRVDAAPGAINLDATPVVCQTTDFAVTGFPRRAYADLTFTGVAAADIDIGADLVASLDGGTTWGPLNAVASRGFVPANGWGQVSNLGHVDLAVGDNMRFGVRMTRGAGNGTANLTDSRCELRTLIYSRNGAASPF